MKKKSFACQALLLATLLCSHILHAQLPPAFDSSFQHTLRTEPTTRHFMSPTRIVWSTGRVAHAEQLLAKGTGQADLSGNRFCVLMSDSQSHPGLLVDFGKELHGGLQLVTDRSRGGKPIKVHIRFGESVSEAMSIIEPIKNATNDHAMRDYIVELPWLGKLEVGNTGFRFVRIDLVDSSAELKLKELQAILVLRNLPYLGSFHCSDTLLNQIWMTGAYTVHLNMQDYLWDGIKRDRLVWVGDMHPEMSTIATVFGYNEVVPKSLDLARDITPLPEYMDGMASYSMWWVLIQRDWYMYTGNLFYLRQQKDYLTKLLQLLTQKIDSTNSEHLEDGKGFLDWPSSENPKGIHAGLQGMLCMTLEAGAELCETLNDPATAQQCKTAAARLRKHVPDANGSKQAAALLSLSGLLSPAKANALINEGGVHHFSTFFGYYMLQAQAAAGDYNAALNAIRGYWGPMLQLGATTFWEDFNVDWLPNASRIDELVPEGKKDIHGDYGAYCYKGFRHSLAHGWASGPTPWLSRYVLGIHVLKPGCKEIRLEPHLGDLTFAEGTFPTPYGLVKVKHVKLANGQIKTNYSAPPQVKILL